MTVSRPRQGDLSEMRLRDGGYILQKAVDKEQGGRWVGRGGPDLFLGDSG